MTVPIIKHEKPTLHVIVNCVVKLVDLPKDGEDAACSGCNMFMVPFNFLLLFLDPSYVTSWDS